VSPHSLYLSREVSDDHGVTTRAHPRYAIELDALIEVVGVAGIIHGRTQDISAGGFCMQAPIETPTVVAGNACEVKLALVFSETEFSEQLTLRGIVAWSTRLKRGVQIGIKFQEVNAQSLQYLDLFIKFLEEGRDAPEAEAKAKIDGSDPGEP
jgi:hypothetical protein